MDDRLVAWARQVKARRKGTDAGRRSPPLWLFTDDRRLPDPCAAVAALPRGLAGVVFRHDGAPGRAVLALRVARLCRERRLVLAVAGDWRLAARCHAGLHLRAGHAPVAPRWMRHLTASAHGRADVVRGRRADTALGFISPVFVTASHPVARGLGPARWARLARLAGGRAAALGGLDGATVRRLPGCAGAGAISALAPKSV